VIDSGLLEILRCPETRSPVVPSTPEETAAFNRAIAAGQVKNRAGQPVAEAVECLLICADRKVAYAVRDTIPLMLMEEAIALEGIL
jgi:uncharacterized protein YbaR (Trm112 family)